MFQRAESTMSATMVAFRYNGVWRQGSVRPSVADWSVWAARWVRQARERARGQSASIGAVMAMALLPPLLLPGDAGLLVGGLVMLGVGVGGLAR